jgi:hypothetical protein
MNKIHLVRALLLAGALAAAGAAHGALLGDKEASETSTVSTQTWFFPDGSSHTVNLGATASVPAAPETHVMGAAPALLDDDSPLQAASTPTQTWFFPDGSSHTVKVH